MSGVDLNDGCIGIANGDVVGNVIDLVIEQVPTGSDGSIFVTFYERVTVGSEVDRVGSIVT